MSEYSKINYDDYLIWQDKDIRFDVPKNQLALRIGEKIIDNIENIEDTKGCNGDIGIMLLTSLRMIWYCQSNVKINLTIGFDCILSSEIKQCSSKVIGETTALYLKCRFNNNRFEFVFNSLTNTDIIFKRFNLINKAYDATRLYREIKLKGVLSQEKNIILLPEEQILNKFLSVSNLQNDQSLAGLLYITNVRICWFSNNIENYNFSLPWIQIRIIKLKDHAKFGKAISLETNKQLGGNTIMLKFNAGESLENVVRDLIQVHLKFLENPLLGVELSKIQNNKENKDNYDLDNLEKDKKNQSNNDVNSNNMVNQKLSVIAEINESKLDNSMIETLKNNEIQYNSAKLKENNININNKSSLDRINENNEKREKFNNMLLNEMNDEVEVIYVNYFNEQPAILNYLTSNQEKRNTINDIMYCPELGISVERLPDGVYIDSLWKIILN